MDTAIQRSMQHRGTHENPSPNSSLYRHGKKQASISIERYHKLCAALQKQYTIRGYADSTLDPVTGHRDGVFDPFNQRKMIIFDQYTMFKLEPVSNVKLHPREDGTIHPGDLEVYRGNYEDNWKFQEAGPLYWLAEDRDFWNCMLNYHSSVATCGIPELDALFNRLRNEGYPKKIIPCMFFGREAGCLDGACPFLHDREAVQANRAEVITKRMRELQQESPSPRLQTAKRRQILSLEAGSDFDARERYNNSGVLDREMKSYKAFCNYLPCLRPWKDTDPICPLRRCSRCRIAMYCSDTCQKADWSRHKKEPCLPIEDIAINDDLWNPFGTRKGTELFPIDWGDGHFHQ